MILHRVKFANIYAIISFKQALLLILLSCFFSAAYLHPGYSKDALQTDAENAEAQVSQPAVFLADVKNKKHPICGKIDKLLSIAENRNYIASTNDFDFSKLSIPKGIDGFENVKWIDANEDEFRNKLPREYANIVGHLDREGKRGGGITDISRTTLDIYNRGVKNELYRVWYDNLRKNYLVEPDPVRWGFKKIFDDNADVDEPFIYNNETLLSERSDTMFSIIQYKSLGQGKTPVKTLCLYHLK